MTAAVTAILKIELTDEKLDYLYNLKFVGKDNVLLLKMHLTHIIFLVVYVISDCNILINI